jgi:hypothetical protein
MAALMAAEDGDLIRMSLGSFLSQTCEPCDFVGQHWVRLPRVRVGW